MAEHTPGPWAWHIIAGERALAGGDPDNTFILRTNRRSMRYITLSAADANLIAAAPDLLAACEEVAAHTDTWSLVTGHAPACDATVLASGACDCGMDRARAAIAKARGQEGSED